MNSIKIEVLDNDDSLLEPIVDGYLRREPGKAYKDIELLKSLNTEVDLFRYLNTNSKSGTLDRLASQKRWGLNKLPKREMTPFCRLVWDAGSDPMLRILMIAGIASLVLGVLFGESPKVEWIEGAAIFLAVWIVVFVTATNDFMKEKQFENLYLQEHKFCSVIRDGEIQNLDIEVLVVGDVVQIETGDQIPADCLLIHHHKIKIDESSITGESELIHKTPVSEIFNATGGSLQKDIPSPVILSGSVVSSGFGRCVVIAVGLRSQVGKLFIKLAVDTEPTPLQNKLNGLARDVGKIGFLAALLTLLALNATYWTLYLLNDQSASASEIASTMVKYLVISITIVVVAVPEGLPLAVTIALAFSVNRMLKDQNYVRRLASCETMGGANEICSDKTGTLTRNQMEVETYWNGSTFDQSLPENYLEILAQNISLNSTAYLEFINPELSQPELTQPGQRPKLTQPGQVEITPNNSGLEQSKGIFGHYKQIGSPTECALLLFLLRQKSIDYSTLRRKLSSNVVISIPFDSSRKSMTTILAIEESSCDLKSEQRSLLDPTPRGSRTYRLLVKGAAELVLRRCEYRVDSSGNLKRFDFSKLNKVESNVIEHMSSEGLRTVCLAYRDFDPSRFPDWDQEDENGILKIESNLICLGIAGIRDPVRAEVPGAVRKCQSAGIRVRMCTGDNIETAKQIGIKACIYHPERGGLAMLGSDFLKAVGGVVCSLCKTAKCPCENKSPYTFCESTEVDRNCCCWSSSKDDNFGPLKSPDKKRIDVLGDPEEFEKIIENLEILARSQPTDKYALVTGLKNRGAVVAVTGDGVNDAPALKKADVGFAMGITGKEVAKQAADIVLLDDNFESIVRAVKWGRNIYDNIQKFLQFQLTVNAVAVLTAFIGAVVLRGSPLTAVQLLWINLIMDTFAALALATEKPTDDVLHRPPHSRSEYLVNKVSSKFLYKIS